MDVDGEALLRHYLQGDVKMEDNIFKICTAMTLSYRVDKVN